MMIKKTFERKTKTNHYKRWFLQTGKDCLFLYVNNGIITSIRHRLYKDIYEEQIAFEIKVTATPEIFAEAVSGLLCKKIAITVRTTMTTGELLTVLNKYSTLPCVVSSESRDKINLIVNDNLDWPVICAKEKIHYLGSHKIN